jgi:glycosyltransferase involved in cell wall biosynthesis
MISLVVPAYNESAVLQQLYDRIVAAATKWGDTWELLIVDDGSSDNTLDMATRIGAQPEAYARPGTGTSVREGVFLPWNGEAADVFHRLHH